MVARRGGDDPGAFFVGSELRNEGDPAPDLEGAGRVVVLVLDENLTAELVFARPVAPKRSVPEEGDEALPCLEDVTEVGR